MLVNNTQVTIPMVWRRRLLLAVKMLIAAGLVYYLVASGRLNLIQIMGAFRRPVFILAGALCCTLAFVTPIFRWWTLSRVQRLELGALDALRLTMIGYFFNVLIPSGSGGDLVRAAYTVRDCPERRAQALTVAFVDRGLGLHALLLIGVTVIFFESTLITTHSSLKPWLLTIVGLLIFGTIAPLFLVSNRTNGLFMRFCGRLIGGPDAWNEAVQLYRQELGMLSLAYAFSLGSAIFNILAIHFMMLAVGSTPTILESMAIAPSVILANTVPLTPGGLGLAEGASAGLYALVGQAGGANGMLLMRCFVVLYALLGLPFFLFSNCRDGAKFCVSSKYFDSNS